VGTALYLGVVKTGSSSERGDSGESTSSNSSIGSLMVLSVETLKMLSASSSESVFVSSTGEASGTTSIS
jgi:hypothetical protein